MSMWTTINLLLAILLTVGVSAVAVLVPWRLDRPSSAPAPRPQALPASPVRRPAGVAGAREATSTRARTAA